MKGAIGVSSRVCTRRAFWTLAWALVTLAANFKMAAMAEFAKQFFREIEESPKKGIFK